MLSFQFPFVKYEESLQSSHSPISYSSSVLKLIYMSYSTSAAYALPIIQEKVACFVLLHFKSLNIEDLLFDIELHGPVNTGASGMLYLMISWVPPFMSC